MREVGSRRFAVDSSCLESVRSRERRIYILTAEGFIMAAMVAPFVTYNAGKPVSPLVEQPPKSKKFRKGNLCNIFHGRFTNIEDGS